MAISQVVAGSRIVISQLNQYYNLLRGVAGETITLIHNSAPSLSFQPSSDPAAGTEAIQVKNNAGTVQAAITFDGKVKVADGTATLPSLRFQSEASGLYLSAAGVIGVAASGATTNILMRANAVSVGATPASVGAVRVPNAANAVVARNAANSADIVVATLDASDRVQIANGSNFLLSNATGVLTLGGPGDNATGRLITGGTLTAGGLLSAGIQICTSGPLIYSGSGAPTISAAVKGSLYLRSDGSSTSTRAYIATDTAGTWTALTTAA